MITVNKRYGLIIKDKQPIYFNTIEERRDYIKKNHDHTVYTTFTSSEKEKSYKNMNVEIKQQIILQAIETQRQVNNEIKIVFSKDGIHFKAVSEEHAEMMISFISKKTCKDYQLKNNEELEIGIDAAKLKDFLKIGKKNDIFTFDIDSDRFCLIIKLGYLTRTIGLIDPNYIDNMKIPNLKLKNHIIVNTKMFYDNLKKILYEPIKKDSCKKKPKQLYQNAYLTIQPECIVLENIDGYNENKDKKKREHTTVKNDVLTIISSNNATTAFNTKVFKHLQIIKKNWEQITLETDYFHPIKITGDNNLVKFQYWRVPFIPNNIDHKKFEETQKQTIIKEDIKKPDFEITTKNVEKNKLEPMVKIKTVEPLIALKKKSDKTDIYADRLSICKPKGLPYDKHQWTCDMEKIKNKLGKSLGKQDNKTLLKAGSHEGFVFFIVNLKDKTTVDNIALEVIIEKLLPNRFVLIAWYQYKSEKLIVQTVEKVN